MATLSITQMYALARGAGLSPADAVIAAAIGDAESSGRTGVTSPNPFGGTNVGVWQLDTEGAGSGYTVAQLSNPQTNAAVMAKASQKGKNWSQWESYTTGRYQKFMSQAQQASGADSGPGWFQTIVDAIGAGGVGIASDAGGNPAGVLGSILSLPEQVTDFFVALEQPVHAAMWLFSPTNWARIIAGALGFLLLAAGLITLGLAA